MYRPFLRLAVPVLAPFKAVRPPRDKAHLVASRSYISYTKNELSDKLNGNPFTFLHLINPEASLGIKPTKNTRERFAWVKKRYEEWCAKGYLQADNQPGYYIYRQTQPSHEFTGILGCTSVMDYEDGKIKIHEHTLTEREQVFVDYLEITGFHAEPVLLTYPDVDEIAQLIKRITSERAEFDFSTTDTVRHQLWPVFDTALVQQIGAAFNSVDDFYIADGHHRSASSYRLALAHKESNWDASSPLNYFMSLVLPESEVHIEPFHRLVRDLNELSPDGLIAALRAHFEVVEVNQPLEAKPVRAHQFGMYLDKRWYTLDLKPEVVLPDDPVRHLDPDIISRFLLQPILGIGDLKTDPRIACIGGKDGHISIEKAIDSGDYRAGFWLFPTSMAEVKIIADQGLSMPPKSTWVEPKLRSGLTVYPFGHEPS
ncbi:MAG TPA: DUF1015 domain-containing protein [Luteibaculaceae bacterium]|nr:DUF1015 domain-containing protein [Luteibaculaceae bacterium]